MLALSKRKDIREKGQGEPHSAIFPKTWEVCLDTSHRTTTGSNCSLGSELPLGEQFLGLPQLRITLCNHFLWLL